MCSVVCRGRSSSKGEVASRLRVCAAVERGATLVRCRVRSLSKHESRKQAKALFEEPPPARACDEMEGSKQAEMIGDTDPMVLLRGSAPAGFGKSLTTASLMTEMVVILFLFFAVSAVVFITPLQHQQHDETTPNHVVCEFPTCGSCRWWDQQHWSARGKTLIDASHFGRCAMAKCRAVANFPPGSKPTTRRNNTQSCCL